ncbi:MAG: hypothetical protein ABI747_01000 [Candidatus Moraniibacteriota bacterium]
MNRFEDSAPRARDAERKWRKDVPNKGRTDDPGKPIEPPASFNVFDEAMLAHDRKIGEVKKGEKAKDQPKRLSLEEEIRNAVAELSLIVEKVKVIKKILDNSQARLVQGVEAINKAQETGNKAEEIRLRTAFANEGRFIEKFRKENPLEELIRDAEMLKTRIEVLGSQRKK